MERVIAKLISIVLLMAMLPPCVQAQRYLKPLTAHQRGIKGAVHVVEGNCVSSDGMSKTNVLFEYSRKGEEIRGPKLVVPDCMVVTPGTQPAGKRNSRGDVEEFSVYLFEELFSTERYEYEYDDRGNWIKRTTVIMRNYEIEGGSWKAGEWQAKEVCTRKIEYYP
jgi:hypothetical protein